MAFYDTLTPPVLKQDKVFIKEATPLDFSAGMGCYALEIKYTNGDTQMFTTRSTHPNVYQSFEFETKDELLAFFKQIKP